MFAECGSSISINSSTQPYCACLACGSPLDLYRQHSALIYKIICAHDACVLEWPRISTLISGKSTDCMASLEFIVIHIYRFTFIILITFASLLAGGLYMFSILCNFTNHIFTALFLLVLLGNNRQLQKFTMEFTKMVEDTIEKNHMPSNI